MSVLNTSIQPEIPSFIEINVANPFGEEIAFECELPWEKGSFKIVEGKHRVSILTLRIGKYRGVLKWVWHGEENSIDLNIEVSEPTGPNRPMHSQI